MQSIVLWNSESILWGADKIYDLYMIFMFAIKEKYGIIYNYVLSMNREDSQIQSK